MATQAEVAAHLDLSQSAVSQMMQAGVLPAPAPRRGLDLAACRVAYVRHLRGVAAGRLSDPTEDGLDLVAERARLAKEQADAQAMKNDLMRGEVVLVADAVRQVTQDYAAVRTRLLAIPSEAAPRAHACRSTTEVQAVLMAAVCEAMADLTAHEPLTPARSRRAAPSQPSTRASPAHPSASKGPPHV